MRYALISDIHANLPALQAVQANIAKTLQGDDGRFRYGRCFLECQIGRFQRDGIFRHRYIFRIGAQTAHG